MTNERTSKRVASIAGKVLKIEPSQARLWAFRRNGGSRRLPITINELRALAASALTQAADKPNKDQRHKVRVKATGFDRVLDGPVELLPVYDDRGFDPRDGGKIGRATHNAMGDRIKPRKILPPKRGRS